MNEFIFYKRLIQVTLSGKRASSIPELIDGIAQAEPSSIFYHTHRFLHQHIDKSPEPPNDFGYWIGNVLNIEWLSEQLSSVNLVQLSSIGEVRNTYLHILREYIEMQKYVATCPPGQEFHFMGCKTFVIESGYRADGIREFRDCLKLIDINSIIYHVFDIKLHRSKSDNDFSIWFDNLGMNKLAAAIRHLDPYTYTLEGLRKQILILVSRYEKN